MRKQTFAAILAAAGVLGTTSATLADSALYFGISSEPRNLEPQIQAGTVHRSFTLTFHRGLVNYGIDGALSNELAESYEIAPDAMSMTFLLRDAKFHNGEPVTADDVKATFDRIMAPESTGGLRNQFEIVETVEAVDPKTVRIVFKRPSVTFVHYLALPEAVILPASWIAQYGDDATGAEPIGAGPFKFADWQRGREMTVEKFDEYYKEGKPRVDQITFQFYADENTRTNALKSGDVDIIDYLPAREMKSIEADPDLKLASTVGPFMAVQFNTRAKPFDDPRVRRAVGYAIDRQAVVNTAFDGVGSPVWGLGIPEGYPAYDAEKANYFSLDYEKAKEMLAEAGYPDGFEVRMVSSSQYSFHQNTAIAVQAELAKIGVKVNLDLSDWATRTSKILNADYDMAVMGTVGEITDPDWLAYHYYGGENLVRNVNPAYFNNSEVNEMLDEGRRIVDTTERAALYDRLTDRLLEESPLVFLMFRDQSYALRKNIEGFTNLPAFLTFLSAYSLENVEVK